MELSNENLLQSLLDPVTFAESFIKLETPEGLIRWHMDPYQKKLMRDQNRTRAINKSKKTGISTTIAGESIHKAIIHGGRQIVFVSTGLRIAEELLGKWYDMYDTLPEHMKSKFDKKSMQVARLPNGSRIISLPSSKPANIRGLGMRGPQTDVYVDEFAHVANDRELWVVVRDFQLLGGNITLNSTPKGNRGKYYEIVEPLQAMHHQLIPDKETDWSYHEIPYWYCPRLVDQEEFLRKDMTDIDFRQEYCCEFIDESLSFFPYELIWENQKISNFVSTGYKTKNPILFGIDFGQRVSETIIYIVEEVAPEKFKTLYIEILPGVNYDEQVSVITILAKEFNPVAINIDATGPGGQVMEDMLMAKEEISHLINGYDLSSSFKENIIIRLRLLFKRHRFDIPDKTLRPYGDRFEMQLHGIQRTTTKTGMHTRYSGKETGYDDMVWAAALAVFKEFIVNFEPMIVQVRDGALERLTRREREERKIDVSQDWMG